MTSGAAPSDTVVGALLAGGAGRRLLAGDHAAAPSKAAVELAGRPLASYPLAALAEVCRRVAVVCKRGTAVPEIGATERWDEPDEPRHPLVGIVHALERGEGPVLVCAADMPFVTAEACREVMAAAGAGALAAVAASEQGVEPLLALYTLRALPALRAAPAAAPLRATVASLEPVRVDLPAALLRSVNTPSDLATAAATLRATVV